MLEAHSQQPVPLFMVGHSKILGSMIEAKEGRDYMYDPESQRSIWISCRPVWSRTPYGDEKVDSHTWVTPDGPAVPPPSPM